MILSETKVWTPEGWQEARLLKEQSTIYSWNGRHWIKNFVEKINMMQVKTVMAIICLDGMIPSVFRCTPDQEICLKHHRYQKAQDLLAGTLVTCSEGAHVFRAEVALIEKEYRDSPEFTLSFDLANRPRNFLAASILCR